MEVLHPHCAGLDIHKDSVVACVRHMVKGKVATEVRVFQTTTRELMDLSDWLAVEGATHIAMEATGVYWKPIWHILADAEFELVLANAAHVKNVPGRKADVKDAVWLSDLMAHQPLAAQTRLNVRSVELAALQFILALPQPLFCPGLIKVHQ